MHYLELTEFPRDGILKEAEFKQLALSVGLVKLLRKSRF